MAVAIPEKEVAFPSDNIIIGFAEIKARSRKGVVQWELPGGGYTQSKVKATDIAKQMDDLIQANMKKFNRSLLWS
jgi:hypothetical protein